MPLKYDVITIGDCTTDAFIRLKIAKVTKDKDGTMALTMPFADKIPYESLETIPAVGNSSNVAVALSRLGLKSAILTAIGDDYYGRQVLATYRAEGVGTDLIAINKGVPTNYHFVLNYGAERTILIRHNEYRYHDPSLLDDVLWVYFSSMGENTLQFHKTLGRYLKAHPEIKLGFNPGTFQLKLGRGTLADIYASTHVLFVNREEAQIITGAKTRLLNPLFKALHALGPKIIAITDGPAGAYASDGERAWFLRSYPDPKPPFSRTGAGDAFAGGFFGALMLGESVSDALRWGPINSMSVVQYTGARHGLLRRADIEKYLLEAPADYEPKEL